MTSVKPVRAPLIELFGRGLDLLRTELMAQAGGLRPSRLRVLWMIPDGGCSVTELADLLTMTKQGAGQLVTQLVASGHLEETADPRDGRVRLVRRTPSGDEAITVVERVNTEAEARWRAEIGEERWAAFREVLEQVTGVR